ncbi:hypothetical protein ASPWEDRAFT_174822 [Aspergillus wentii DTO 134E9]|uniref:ATP-grasp domain-containing protein n=1 Tax=Aspergillus wentii DTO 134E9 TaxID=1073089 RepID=A0A1L9RER9_ASPWE|nr:uncharacterized protein ASPWEDRAFT_174822 [Aspergillus wentii DTO 134E9]KAI9933662.1 hypothetical protein MW887_008135 [Aspergillus wentii]OJJ33415.1 hypothetical protein ASPWEDRAFT_174822 [Aspergillus wentii DTO 134E9]
MRICVLQPSHGGSGSNLEESTDAVSKPGAHTSQHKFENRFIHMKTAREEIDNIVAEGFDFYINLLWGTLDDPVAGIQASQYFESLGVPSAGVRSWQRSRNKKAFHENARRRGAPPVPGTTQFPLVVKPASGRTSQMIDENSVCYNETELNDALRRINSQMYPFRLQRAKALGIMDPQAYIESYDPVGRSSDDIVIQEYIDGEDYVVTVIEMGDSAIALNPCIMKSKGLSRKEKFVTLDLKLDPKTRMKLITRDDDPALFGNLQQAALEAFEAGMFRGSYMGCDVDFRVRPDGQVFVIGANPLPAAFLPGELKHQGLPTIESLPGGHTAVVDIFITNYFLRNGIGREWGKVAANYDDMAQTYDGDGETHSQDAKNFQTIVQQFDFAGTVFDLACGTGFFGRVLAANRPEKDYSLTGFDISVEMVAICRKTGLYSEVYIDRMQTCLLKAHDQAEADHIVCFGAAHFLSPEELTFCLVLCFVVARKSITIAIDEIPDSYNENLDRLGHSCMRSLNHLAHMESFGVPRGWRLISRQRQYSWTSPTTGDDVFSNFFRFERIDGENGRDIKALAVRELN